MEDHIPRSTRQSPSKEGELEASLQRSRDLLATYEKSIEKFTVYLFTFTRKEVFFLDRKSEQKETLRKQALNDQEEMRNLYKEIRASFETNHLISKEEAGELKKLLDAVENIFHELFKKWRIIENPADLPGMTNGKQFSDENKEEQKFKEAIREAVGEVNEYINEIIRKQSSQLLRYNNREMNKRLEELKDRLTSSNLPMSQLLMEAKAILHNQADKDFLNWLDAEIEGYDIQKMGLPDYRRRKADQIICHTGAGVVPVICPYLNELPAFNVGNPVASIEEPATDGFRQRLSDEAQEKCMQATGRAGEYSAHFSDFHITEIINAVRNKLLQKIVDLQPGGTFESNEEYQGEIEIIQLITYDTDSALFKGHVDEVNRAYTHGCYTAVFILLRKIVENLLVKILKTKFPSEQDLYFDKSQQRFKNFSIILENLHKKKSAFGEEKKAVERLYQLAGDLREQANDQTHSFYHLAKKEEIDNLHLLEIIELIKILEDSIHSQSQ